MKKKPKKVRKILCCIGVAIVALFLGGCVSTFFDTLHAEKGDIFSHIGQIALVLSELVYDYGLEDDEIKRIVRDDVHDAVSEYRKSHPLGYPPPSYEVDFINVIPYE